MKTVTDFPRRVVCQEDVGIVMPDGCRLSARIWMPEDADEKPVPVILEHLPYRKRDGTTARDCLSHPYLAGYGYACIRTDMRGNGDSQGLMEDEYTQQELDDACAVLDWAAAQPWSTGTAGMMGISWGGFNSLQVAAMRPPSLKAIITICSTTDRFADDIHYKGGCQLIENLGWAATMLAYSSRPPDPAIVGDAWRDMWLERLENQPFLLTEWLRHQRRDAFWKHGSVCEDYSAIEASVLSIGGWHDGYRNTISHLVSNLDAPVKGIIGPWIHKYPHFAAPKPAIGFLQEALRWWDRWLKDIDTGVEADPAMRLWLMDSVKPAAWLDERPGRWIACQTWPAPEIGNRTLHLVDEALTSEPGEAARSVSSPADCGAAAGEYFPFMFGPELPLDQRGDDAGSACFDSKPLEDPIDVVGAPRLRLRCISDQPLGQVAVRLTDVFEDGTSALVTYGFLNLAHRASHETPKPLTPGKPFEIAFDLDQIAYRVPAGHRLRVAVSTASWPSIWPAPAPVLLQILTGSVDLPLRPLAEGDEWHFEEPEGATPWNIEERREGDSFRRREENHRDGTSVMVIENDHGEVLDLDHGLQTGSRSTERWTIAKDDPLSARGEIEWETTMKRGDWSVATTCRAAMRSTASHFLISASIEARENGKEVFSKTFEEKIERDCG
jgi:putative CocE/NonD family hydrolase